MSMNTSGNAKNPVVGRARFVARICRLTACIARCAWKRAVSIVAKASSNIVIFIVIDLLSKAIVLFPIFFKYTGL
jgi:hypothetical protein